MSAISSSVGLISGLPIQEIVDGLISIQRRPITLVENRLAGVTALRTTLLDLSARLFSLRADIDQLKVPSFFRSASATSGDESVLTALASSSAPNGQFNFTVRRLASTFHAISSGFASADSAYLSPGKLTIDSAAARVNNSTSLSVLRGGQGVRLGKVRVTDGSGAAANIDLSGARSIDDVLSAFNNQTNVSIRASVAGDKIVLEDLSGSTTSAFSVADIEGGFAAADLGINGSTASTKIFSSDLVSLSSNFGLDLLNDGNGIRIGTAGLADFRILPGDGEAAIEIDLSGRLTSDTPLSKFNGGNGVSEGSFKIKARNGIEFDVDTTGATTAGDILSRINSAASDAGVSVTASIDTTTGGFKLVDGSDGTGTLTVTAVDDAPTARDLGLLTAATDSTLTGSNVYRVRTLGDVINEINNNPLNSGRVLASLSDDGDAIVLTDQTGTGNVTVENVDPKSKAAQDLGILGSSNGSGEIRSGRLLSSLNSVLLSSLNGGSGVATGLINITNRSGGAATQVDLTGAQTLAEVIDRINAAGAGVTASVSSSGLGIQISDTTGGTGNLTIEGQAAESLGIAYSGSNSVVQNGNLQKRYVSESTRLEQFNGGLGVPRGKFRITDASGQSAIVDLTQGNENTLRDVIEEINSRPIDVIARINDNGDGIIIEDSSGGAGLLKIEDIDGGTTAKALRLAGVAKSGNTFIDGSLETHLDITSGDTLNSVLTRLQATGGNFSAAIINDGGSVAPYRLSITSLKSGRAGQLAIDGGTSGLNFSTLSVGRDALIEFGGEEGSGSILITSSSNRFENVVNGLTIEAKKVSSTPVSVNVGRNLEFIVERLNRFTTSYNAVLARIKQDSTFNEETERRGVLLGDRTAAQVEQRLNRFITQRVSGQPNGANSLQSVGFKYSEGELTFDEAKFAEAYAANPTAVEELFTAEETGLAAVFKKTVDDLTDVDRGTFTLRQNSLTDIETSLRQRVDQMKVLLDSKRERLLSQFFAAEQAISKLQSQQNSLGSLSALTT